LSSSDNINQLKIVAVSLKNMARSVDSPAMNVA